MTLNITIGNISICPSGSSFVCIAKNHMFDAFETTLYFMKLSSTQFANADISVLEKHFRSLIMDISVCEDAIVTTKLCDDFVTLNMWLSKEILDNNFDYTKHLSNNSRIQMRIALTIDKEPNTPKITASTIMSGWKMDLKEPWKYFCVDPFIRHV